MSRHALVVADGEVPIKGRLDVVWPGWDEGVDLVVAADGGALRAARLERPLDLVVGDLDSLAPAAIATLRTSGVPIERAPTGKDESDTELAVLAAVARGATRLTILGAFGGPRLDHAFANVWLLAHPALTGRDAILLDATTRVRLLSVMEDPTPAAATLEGRVGDLVTLLPFDGPAEGLVTDGLRYPLRGETLVPGPARGLSNVRLATRATVRLGRGRLLIVEVSVFPAEAMLAP